MLTFLPLIWWKIYKLLEEKELKENGHFFRKGDFNLLLLLKTTQFCDETVEDETVKKNLGDLSSFLSATTQNQIRSSCLKILM